MINFSCKTKGPEFLAKAYGNCMSANGSPKNFINFFVPARSLAEELARMFVFYKYFVTEGFLNVLPPRVQFYNGDKVISAFIKLDSN